ncbi:hypothetical protein LguiA_022359 [Lonicera macranthoides]
MILWNPAIRRKLTLPLPQYTSGHYVLVHGFEFDCKANDYKIVRLAYRKVGDIFIVSPLVEVYSVKTGAWRGIGAPAPLNHIAGYLWRQAFVSGAAHWVAYPSIFRGVESLILSFDMCNEVFHEIMLPVCLAKESPWYMGVVAIEDSLSIVKYDKLLNMHSVWVMKEYCVVESWTKRYNIETEDGLGIMLGVWRNGEMLLTTRNDDLVAYNVRTQESMNLITGGNKNSFFVDTYKESLALLFEGEKMPI